MCVTCLLPAGCGGERQVWAALPLCVNSTPAAVRSLLQGNTAPWLPAWAAVTVPWSILRWPANGESAAQVGFLTIFQLSWRGSLRTSWGFVTFHARCQTHKLACPSPRCAQGSVSYWWQRLQMTFYCVIVFHHLIIQEHLKRMQVRIWLFRNVNRKIRESRSTLQPACREGFKWPAYQNHPCLGGRWAGLALCQHSPV